MNKEKEVGQDRTLLFIVGLTLVVVVVIFVLGLRAGRSSESPNVFGVSQSGGVGQKAPDFNLPDFEGQRVSLDSLKGKKAVLFFSEGLMCYPACWDQMAKLGSDPRLNSEEIVSYSIIVDRPESWQRAFEKMPELRSAKVLFDNNVAVSRAFKTLELPSSMHRGQIPGHTYFILDGEGVVRYFFDDPQMGIRNDLIWEELDKI